MIVNEQKINMKTQKEILMDILGVITKLDYWGGGVISVH